MYADFALARVVVFFDCFYSFSFSQGHVLTYASCAWDKLKLPFSGFIEFMVKQAIQTGHWFFVHLYNRNCPRHKCVIFSDCLLVTCHLVCFLIICKAIKHCNNHPGFPPPLIIYFFLPREKNAAFEIYQPITWTSLAKFVGLALFVEIL